MNRSVLFKIFKFLLVVFLFLLILEFGSRGLLSIKLIDNLICKNECDVVWRWKWLERHRHGAGIFYQFDKYDPAKGWEMLPNISGMSCFKKKVFNSNSRGIRGKVEYAYTKDKNKVRILFLGDSYTFGDNVSDNETYPFYLQQMLPNTEVINMGGMGMAMTRC